MASNAHNVIVIDQLGDAIITLKNPNVPFAVWKESGGAEEVAPESGAGLDGTKRKIASGGKTLERRPKQKNPRASSKRCEDDNASQLDPYEDNVANTSIKYQVSSRHLVSGSAKFEAS
jgi:hypothetical protein